MIYIAFTMGLLSSFHCVGMCGPIALAVPVHTTNPLLKLFRYLLFNAGRIATYAVLGLLIGFAGKGFVIAGWQQLLSVLTGVMVLLIVFFSWFSSRLFVLQKIFTPFTEKLKQLFSTYIHKRGSFALLVLGVLNGFLPCGMVYAAMLGALSAGDQWSGALFMVMFGIGTTPALIAVALSGSFLGSKVKGVMNRISPLLAVVVAVLLILRGLNLGIPYVSPEVEQGKVQKCHGCSAK